MLTSCPFCDHTGPIPDGCENQRIRCPRCAKSWIVPSAAESASALVSESLGRTPEERVVVLAPAGERGERKPCPFCGESILGTAKKCKHCGEIIDPVLRAAEEAKRERQGVVHVTTSVNTPSPYQYDRRPLAPTNGFATASLVFGLLALFLCWIPIVSPLLSVIGFLCGVIGFLVSFARSATGLVTSLFGMGLSVFAFFLGGVFLVTVLQNLDPQGKWKELLPKTTATSR